MRSILLALATIACLGAQTIDRGVVEVYSSGTVDVGTTRQLTVYVGDITPNGVNWFVNDIPGGNATYGTISPSGLYTAPPVAPTPNGVIVKAISIVKPTKFGAVTLTVQQPTPWVWGVSPNPVLTGPITLSINGSNFVPGAVVRFGATSLTTTYVNPTTLTATGAALVSQVGTVNVTVFNPDPGGVVSQPKAVTLKLSPADSPSVTVTPTPVSVLLGASKQFAATTKNLSNPAVTWFVNDVAGGNSTVGTVTSGGLYTAPAVMPASTTVNVKAVSVQNTSVSGSAKVTLVKPVTLTITSVSPASFPTGAFALTVNGTGFVSGAVINFGGSPLPTVYVSSTQLKASGSASQAGTVPVTVTNPLPGGTSNSLNVEVTNPTPITVTVSPATANVALNAAQQFMATVGGTANQAVTWTLTGAGTLSPSGLYTAPSSMPMSPTATVQAKSAADNTTIGMATITIVNSTPISVTVTPATANVALNATQQFTASVGGTANQAVTWTLTGGGTLSASGLYTAPASMSPSTTATVQAKSVADNTTTGTATVTLTAPSGPSITSITPSPIPAGAFTITVNGAGFVASSVVSFGGVSLPTTYLSANQLSAQGTTTAAQQGGNVSVIVTNPGPVSSPAFNVPVAIGNVLVSAAAASRFLEQAAFGPNPASVTRVQQLGFQGWINEQFTLPIYPNIDPNVNFSGLSEMQSHFFTTAVNAPDQLRQRLVFTLGQIFVISLNKLNYQGKMVPYYNMLAGDAFGNFYTMLRDVTLSPAMGEYLDMVNNDKPNPALGTLANENYARELLQLFSIGPNKLYPDGTAMIDAFGVPMPTYDQKVITEFARVFTGWTYPTQPGHVLQIHNSAYYTGPMEAYAANHDTGAKTLLNGFAVPAGQTPDQDLTSALQNIFNHANVGPFIAKLLIEHLVMSNPSPAYVQRVAATFANNGQGVRGDMKAIIQAVLLDTEARQGDAPSASPTTGGHVREPLLFVSNFFRVMGATIDDTNGLSWEVGLLGETPFSSPSVFNFYSPSYVIPGTTLLGPEFQLQTPTNALSRANWIDQQLTGIYAQNLQYHNVDLTPYVNLAGTPAQLVDFIDANITCGNMPGQMKNYIINAVSATSGNLSRAQVALYLTLTSSFYQVQH
jgi:uncharacterized protein (DUF1800 family)